MASRGLLLFYYAFGGGLGHGTRALALARQLARLVGGHHRIAVNTPFAESFRGEIGVFRAASNLPPLVSSNDKIFSNNSMLREVDWAKHAEGGSVVRGAPSMELLAFPPDGNPGQSLEFLCQELNESPPDLLIVDTFPRGLGGEFARLFSESGASCRIDDRRAERHVFGTDAWSRGPGPESGGPTYALRSRSPDSEGVVDALVRKSGCCPRVLISRGLPEGYVLRYQLTDFVREHYDLVVAPGESSPFEDRLEVARSRPFLIRDFDELPSRNEAARMLDAGTRKFGFPERVPLHSRKGRASSQLVLVVCTGKLEECRQLVSLAESLHESLSRLAAGEYRVVIALPPDLPSECSSRLPILRHFPLIELLPAVDLLVGQGGYNLFHEAGSLGIPSLFRAAHRKYDDQSRRIPEAHRFRSEAELVAKVRASSRGYESRDVEAPDAEHDKAASVTKVDWRAPCAYPNGAKPAAEWIARLLSRPQRRRSRSASASKVQ